MDGAAIVWANAPTALYELVGPNLYRLTADFQDDCLLLQWVVQAGIPEEEVEDYRCVGTELLAQFFSADFDEKFVEVADLAGVREVPPFPIRLFSRKLPEEGATDV
jgi:hypothetical protein